MLNSRNYQAQDQILNSGEEIVSDLEEMKDPNYKVYYHHIKNAVTHLPDGAQLTFRGGQFGTANPEIQAYLDKIANKRGTMVFTKQEAENQIQQEIQAVALSAMVNPGDQRNEAGETDLLKKIDATSLVSKGESAPALLLKQGVQVIKTSK